MFTVQYLAPRMPGFEPELLRPQTCVLSMTVFFFFFFNSHGADLKSVNISHHNMFAVQVEARQLAVKAVQERHTLGNKECNKRHTLGNKECNKRHTLGNRDCNKRHPLGNKKYKTPYPGQQGLQ